MNLQLAEVTVQLIIYIVLTILGCFVMLAFIYLLVNLLGKTFIEPKYTQENKEDKLWQKDYEEALKELEMIL